MAQSSDRAGGFMGVLEAYCSDVEYEDASSDVDLAEGATGDAPDAQAGVPPGGGEDRGWQLTAPSERHAAASKLGSPRRLPPTAERLAPLLGYWAKDLQASDSTDLVCDLCDTSFLVRRACRLITGMDLEVSGAHLSISAIFLRGYRFEERYPLSGAAVRLRRRDLRRGGSQGWLGWSPGGELLLVRTWQAPHEGEQTERFCFVGPDELHVHADVALLGGRRLAYRTLYRRRQ